MPIKPELLSILVCPESRRPLIEAEATLLARVNSALISGAVKNRAGTPILEELSEALIEQEANLLYPIRDGIPMLLVDEAISIGEFNS